MNGRRRAVVVYTFLIAGGVAFAGRVVLAHAQGATDPRLEKILSDWQERQQRFRRVRYRVEGVHVIPKGSLSALLGNVGQLESPPRDIEYTVKHMLLLDFPSNRHRRETEEQEYDSVTGRLTPNRYEMAFDGKQAYGSLHHTRDKRPPVDVGIGLGNLKGGAFDPDIQPLFVGHGDVVITLSDLIYPSHLTLQPATEELSIIGESALEGRRCVVLRTHMQQSSSPFYREIWVDPERESAVVRQITSNGGVPLADAVIKYQELPQGWLPKAWTSTTRVSQSQIAYYERMEVKELTLDPPVTDSDFRIEIKPGMLVEKIDHPEVNLVDPGQEVKNDCTYYRIGEDGGWRQVAFVNGAEVRPWTVWSFWWVAPLAAAAAVVIWLLVRRKTSRGPAA